MQYAGGILLVPSLTGTILYDSPAGRIGTKSLCPSPEFRNAFHQPSLPVNFGFISPAKDIVYAYIIKISKFDQ